MTEMGTIVGDGEKNKIHGMRTPHITLHTQDPIFTMIASPRRNHLWIVPLPLPCLGMYRRCDANRTDWVVITLVQKSMCFGEDEAKGGVKRNGRSNVGK